MPSAFQNISTITQAIELALGPVFLLTGIAGMLNVMSGRLSRIIDRGRYLTERISEEQRKQHENINNEMRTLERRRYYTSLAITSCTVSALLVCLVIVALFFDAMFAIPLGWVIGILFIMATMALVVGLAFFLREVHESSKTVRLNKSE
jgi:F0F1-type ATP synthase assembly protein I